MDLKNEQHKPEKRSIRAQISVYHAQVIGMIGDINYAAAIVNDPGRLDELAKNRLSIRETPTPFELLWNNLLADKNVYFFSDRLLKSVSTNRREIEKYVESIQIKWK